VHPVLTQKERKTIHEDEISQPPRVKHRCGAGRFHKWDEDRWESAKIASPLCGGAGSFSTACSRTWKDMKDSVGLVHPRTLDKGVSTEMRIK